MPELLPLAALAAVLVAQLVARRTTIRQDRERAEEARNRAEIDAYLLELFLDEATRPTSAIPGQVRRVAAASPGR